MTETALTVAIPVYNRRDLIVACVRSALAQDVAELEVLVVDNCSSDGTWEAVRSLSDPRLRLERNERNLGLFGNLNRCCQLATGRYLRILCSDDRLEPGCLGRELDLMRANPGVALLSARGVCETLDGRARGSIGDCLPAGRAMGAGALATILAYWFRTWRNPLNFPSGVLVDAAAIRAVGGFPHDMRMAGDLACYLEILRFGDLLVAGHVGAVIASHPGQETARLDRERSPAPMIEAIRLLRRHALALRGRSHLARFAGNLAFQLLRRRGRRAWRLPRCRLRPDRAMPFLLGLIEVPLHKAILRCARRRADVFPLIAAGIIESR